MCETVLRAACLHLPANGRVFLTSVCFCSVRRCWRVGEKHHCEADEVSGCALFGFSSHHLVRQTGISGNGAEHLCLKRLAAALFLFTPATGGARSRGRARAGHFPPREVGRVQMSPAGQNVTLAEATLAQGWKKDFWTAFKMGSAPVIVFRGTQTNWNYLVV